VKRSGSEFQCLACGSHFAGPHSFARHRTGQYDRADLQCLSVDAMRAAGMTLNRAGFWTISAPLAALSEGAA
jgi:hypothetical protein